MENIYKVLRGYAKLGNAIGDFTQPTNVEVTKSRFIFTYQQGQKLTLTRLRTEDSEGRSVLSAELGLE
jgi:hypothetical protein